MTLDSPIRTVRVATVAGTTVEVPETALLTFIAPLLGFAHLRRFALHQPSPGPLHWLQSLDDAKTAFCVLEPFAAGLDPDYEISGADVADIGATGEADIIVYTLVVLERDPYKSRTNLRAPVLVGRRSRKAKQVVLTDQRLGLRHPLLQPPKAT
jgi:flagellar assembly factor FliW